MHGAGAGAPLGNQNALRHGLYAAETVADRREIAALIRAMRASAEAASGKR